MKLRYTFALFGSMLVLGAVAVIPQAAPAVPGLTSIKIGINSPPKTLNPALAADATSARLLQLTHPGLLQWGENFQPVGLVATHCTQATPTQVQCQLPAGQFFTNGTPLTAARVAQWFGQLQNTARSPLAGGLKGVVINTPTPLQLVFNLPSPTLTFFNTLVETPVADPSQPSAGMGPYTATQEEATGVVTLTTSGSLPALQFVPLADATTRLLKLQKGELDLLVHDLPPTLTRYAEAQAAKQGWQFLAVPSSSYSYLALNFRNPLLAESRVREALSLAINRPLLRKALLHNMAAPAESLLPPGHPAYTRTAEDVYDPLTAESLLEDTTLPNGQTLLLGPDGTRLTLTLLTSTEAFSQRLAQALQAQWAKVGVEVKLRSAEWASFHTSVQEGQFDMALLTWTGLQQPSFYYQVFHSSQTPPNGFNRGAVHDETLDTLTSQLMAAPNTATQTKLAQAVQARVAEVRPYLPLWRRSHVLLMGPQVRGCAMGLAGDFKGLMNCRKN